MADTPDLLQKESHFAFGKNWASYADLVTDEKLAEAEAWLDRLIGPAIRGRRFLDIGCGSGVHSLAALRLGASEVVGVDLDPDSVATTRRILSAYAPDKPWKALEVSVFDLERSSLGQFDVVYSWGVLHHTGDMYRAIRCAAEAVAPGGTFAFALYRKTLICPLWKLEKRFYAHASPMAQRFLQRAYVGIFRMLLPLTGRSFSEYVGTYQGNRGMDFWHDVHDWLGGWPYESISPEETERFMAPLGFQREKAFLPGRRALRPLMHGCDEFVYVRA